MNAQRTEICDIHCPERRLLALLLQIGTALAGRCCLRLVLRVADFEAFVNARIATLLQVR